jgi:hypothetical protein
MRRKEQQHQRRLQRLLAVLVLAAGSAQGWAQTGWGIEQEDPFWTEFVPHLRYLNVNTEVEQNTYKSSFAGGQQTDSRRVYLSPSFGVGWNNFLYHPDLLTFSLLAEPGYNWQQFDGPGYSNNQQSLLLNGQFNGTFLQKKPYLTTVGYARSHDDFHYDFFNSATADSESLNVFTGYREGPVPVTVGFQKTTTDTTGYNQDTVMDQITLNLHARNERGKRGITDLTYQYNNIKYDSSYKLSSFSSQSAYHNVSLTDTESFARSTLSSSLWYHNVSSGDSTSQDLNGSLGYVIEHTPHLRSFYNYSLSVYSTEASESIQHAGAVGLGHQLYESLSSGLNLHASTLTSTYGGNSFESVVIGGGNSENYTKSLGDWGRLSLGNDVNYDVTSQQADGSIQFIADEAYKIPLIGPMLIRLKSPRDISVTSVKKNNVNLAPAEYTVIQTTDPWQIQFFSGGPNNVQPGDSIAVSYTFQSNPSGSYSVFSDNSRISLRFWQDRAEIFAGYVFTENEANSPGFLLQNVQEFEAGANCEWRGFRVQGTYTDHRATLYDYRSVTFSEGYTRHLTVHTTVGIDLSQQWNTYPQGSGSSTNASQTSTFYNFMAHLDWQPTAAFSWHSELGFQNLRSAGYNENLLAGRTYLNWLVGKLEVRLGYEHENQDYSAESRAKDLVFLRMRRNF